MYRKQHLPWIPQIWSETIKKNVIAGCLIFVLQSLMLQIAQNWIEKEKKELVVAKAAYMAEQCPPPNLSGDQAALMVRHMAASF